MFPEAWYKVVPKYDALDKLIGFCSFDAIIAHKISL